MVDNPLVTVLLPVYNGEEFLKEALDSILGQTYRNLEILAINDGSTDESLDLLNSIDDPRMRVVTNEQNLGLIGTLNKGIPLASGKYIVRADADDICLPERIEKQVQFMESNPNVGLSGTGFGTFGPGIELTENGFFHADDSEIRFRHLYQIHLMHGTSIWRTSVFMETGILFDPDFAHAEDYDLFDRISEHTKLSNIPDVLYHIRLHSESVSQKFDSVQEANSVRIKKRGFKRLGLEVNEAQLELFRDLCHHDHGKLKGSEKEVADTIVDVIEGNQEAKYFSQEFLTNRLSELWLGLYLNNASSDLSRQLKGHSIHTILPVGALNKLKFQIKCLKS